MSRTAASRLAAIMLLAMPLAASAETLAIEPGKAVEIECETESIHLEAEKFKATRGKLRLRLELKPAAAPGSAPATPGSAENGTWRIVSLDDRHTASFAAAHKAACADGCPLVAAPGAEPQLWAPRRMAPDALGADESLTVATIKPDALVLRASTFRAKELAALERGDCKLAPPAAPQ